MADPSIVLTAHAEAMLIERRIERARVEAVILDPETVESDPTQPGAVRAFRAIAERQGRHLRVVHIRHRGIVRVLTAFFDRGKQ